MTTQEIQQQNQKIKQQVMELLNWDELKYHITQFDSAFDYLNNNLILPDSTIEAITQNEGLFWKWWQNIYVNIDLQFLNKFGKYKGIYDFEEKMNLLEAYNIYHNVKDIPCYPTRQIFDSINV